MADLIVVDIKVPRSILASLLRDSTFSAVSRRLFQGTDDRRSACCGRETSTFRIGYPHLAPFSCRGLTHLSAPVSWCWKIECHQVASLLRIRCWVLVDVSVSCRGMKHNSDPILDSPGRLDHSNLGEDFFVLRRFFDTKLIGLGFATADPLFRVLS